MKKLLLLFLTLFLLTGCAGPGENPDHATQPQSETPETETILIANPPMETEPEVFSWSQTLMRWQEGDPGVRSHGFFNTTPQSVTDPEDAAEVAKGECTIAWNATSVAWDPVAAMWSVCFFTEGTLGGCQTVYLDTDGITRLVISGE